MRIEAAVWEKESTKAGKFLSIKISEYEGDSREPLRSYNINAFVPKERKSDKAPQFSGRQEIDENGNSVAKAATSSNVTQPAETGELPF